MSAPLANAVAAGTRLVEVSSGVEFAIAVEDLQAIGATLGEQLPAVEVAPPGHAVSVSWASASGATVAEVTSATARVAPAVTEVAMGTLPTTGSGGQRDVTIPGGRRVRSLTLNGLKSAAGVALRSEGDLRAANPNLRLVVALVEGNTSGPPLYSVPPVPARRLLPAALTGASFAGGVLRLPDVPAGKLRLTLATGEFPEDFAAQSSLTLGKVTGTAAVPPRDLELVDPAGAVAWAFPGEMPPQSPAFDVDLCVPLSGALTAALAAGGLPQATLRLHGVPPGRAGFSFSGASGRLVRQFPGVLSTELSGDPRPVPLGGPPLAEEQPATAVADLTVRYAGLRVLETLSDAVPAGRGGIGGVVVTEDGATRELPAGVLAGPPLARIGVIGRAPAACELTVELVAFNGGVAGAPRVPPAVVQVPASTDLATVWAELPAAPEADPTGRVGLRVSASQGRFLWAGEPRPLARFAVRDPDPGGRPLRLGGVDVLRVEVPDLHLPATALPPAVFRSRPPLLASDLFLTVDLSDLALGYPR